MKRPKRTIDIEGTRPCSDTFGVTRVNVRSGSLLYRKKPCEQCPFRSDVPTGVFPAEAFRESAATAYDMAEATFACHMSGANPPATCAGFILTHGEHNLGLRLAAMKGEFDISTVKSSGVSLYPSYREMAIANGVAEDDPVLSPIRAADDPVRSHTPNRPRNKQD